MPFATEIGAPVQIPNSHRTGDPARSHNSIPLIVHVDPPFVHVSVDVFDDASPDAAENVHALPPVVYPDPDSSVMLTVAVGLFVPSRTLIPVVDAVADCLSMAFSTALPAELSIAATQSPSYAQ